MTRHFCGMWEYKTQIMDYEHTESFLAKLILKRGDVCICTCDNNGHFITGTRCNKRDVYFFQDRYCVMGFIFYDTHYRVIIDSLHNVSVVPIY